MNFDHSEAEKKLKTDVKAVFTKDMLPAIGELGGSDPKKAKETLLSVLAGLAPTGYLDAAADPEKLAANPFSNQLGLALAGLEIATISPPLYVTLGAHAELFGWLVARYGTEELKAKYLAPLREGKILGAAALSEYAGNFDSDMVEVKGTKGEGGAMIVTGAKKHVTAAPVADVIAVVGRMDDGLALFFIDPKADGARIGRPIRTMGYSGLLMADLELEGCRVPAADAAGPIDEKALLRDYHVKEDMILTIASLGVMRRAFAAGRSSADKAARGRKPPMAYQEIRYMLAEMQTPLTTSELMLQRAAWMLMENAPEASTVAACAKVFIAESAEEVASKAVQILGDEGCVRGSETAESFSDAKYGQVAGRSSEVLRMLIADDCLSRY
ncbi:MAG: acyl-CoA dehydrogenase [Pseudomonadota bacterium]